MFWVLKLFLFLLFSYIPYTKNFLPLFCNFSRKWDGLLQCKIRLIESLNLTVYFRKNTQRKFEKFMLNLKKGICATNTFHTLIWINISEDCNWIESVRLQRHVSFAQARLSIPSQVIEETVIFSTYIGLTSNDWCLLKFYNITRNCWEDIHDLSEGCALVRKALDFWCQILLEYSQRPTLKQTFFFTL